MASSPAPDFANMDRTVAKMLDATPTSSTRACLDCLGTGRAPNPAYWRERRKAAGYSGEEFAAELGISASHLSDIERGKRRFLPRFLGMYIEMLGEPSDDHP